MANVLDLFSGIGGFSLGLERAGFKTVAFCEIEPFCQKVLRKHWPDAPIYHDIRGLNAERLRKDGIPRIDVVCGGFPCQPYSLAGKRKGTQDHRDLWPQMCRIIEETKPRWVIGENVANFTDMAFTRTKIDLENRGYEVWAFIIPACAIGAPHKRERLWIVAHTTGAESSSTNEQKARGKKQGQSGGVGGTPHAGSFWLREPRICRVDDGLSAQVDRLAALGNAVVPQITEIIGNKLLNDFVTF